MESELSKVDPQEVGDYASALSNTAALNSKARVYVLRGIDYEILDIVSGQTFALNTVREDNEALGRWLL